MVERLPILWPCLLLGLPRRSWRRVRMSCKAAHRLDVQSAVEHPSTHTLSGTERVAKSAVGLWTLQSTAAVPPVSVHVFCRRLTVEGC